MNANENEIETARAEYRAIRARSHACANDRGAGAVWFDKAAARYMAEHGLPASPENWIKAAQLVRVPCRRCIGSGKFTTGTMNGQPTGPGGVCFRCAGKGYQTDADARRTPRAALCWYCEPTCRPQAEGRAIFKGSPGLQRIAMKKTPKGCLTETGDRGCDCTEDRHGYTEAGANCPNACAKTLECGGDCCLDKNHPGACECIGDEPGNPGSCPA